MRTTYKGQPPYATYNVDYTTGVFSIMSKDFDLDDIQEDSEVIVEVYDNSRYVANIIIPPAEYNYVDTGDVDDSGNPILSKEKAFIDIDKVQVVLWHKKEEPEITEPVV